MAATEKVKMVEGEAVQAASVPRTEIVSGSKVSPAGNAPDTKLPVGGSSKSSSRTAITRRNSLAGRLGFVTTDAIIPSATNCGGALVRGTRPIWKVRGGVTCPSASVAVAAKVSVAGCRRSGMRPSSAPKRPTVRLGATLPA